MTSTSNSRLFPEGAFGMHTRPLPWTPERYYRWFAQDENEYEDEDEDYDSHADGGVSAFVAGYHESGRSSSYLGVGRPTGITVGVELELGAHSESAVDFAFALMLEGGMGEQCFRFEHDGSLPDYDYPHTFEAISDYGCVEDVLDLWKPLLTSAKIHGLLGTRRRDGDNGYDRLRNTARAVNGHVIETLFGWAAVPGMAFTKPTTTPFGVLAPDVCEDIYNDPAAYASKVVATSPMLRNPPRDGTRMPYSDAAQAGARSNYTTDMDAFGMHVHVTDAALSDDTCGYVRKRMLDAVLSLFTQDVMQYRWLIGRLPEGPCTHVPTFTHSHSRYDIIACRDEYGTIECRLFAATLNPCMFGARVELAAALFKFAGSFPTGVSTTWQAFIRWLEDVADGPKEYPNLSHALERYATYERLALDDYSGPKLSSLSMLYSPVQRQLPLAPNTTVEPGADSTDTVESETAAVG